MRFIGKRQLIQYKKVRPHPTCPDGCAGKLRGIVENLRITGEVSEWFDVKIQTVPRFGWIPGGTYVAECEHGREFLMLPTEEMKRKVKEAEEG